ncbi:MAG: aminoglycoside phosphotransferase family protein [Deinococcales bacterium]
MTHTKMHAEEIYIDGTLVRRLVATQFSHWAGLPLVRVKSAGTDNALFRLGSDMLVRLPRVHWAVDDVHKEQRWLPRLAPLLPVEIPTPVAMGGPGEGFPWHWSIYRWIEGEPAGGGTLADAGTLATEVASFVLALQRLDTSGAPRAGRGWDLTEQDADAREAIAALEGQLDTDAVSAAWERGLAVPPWKGPPVWIHGDLKPDNLLCRDGHLRAVIDFGGLGVGDPAADMLIAWTLLPPAARDRYRAALDVDAATWRRGRAWALSIALIQLPYYQDTNPTLASSARRVIAEVLEDARTDA